MDLSAMRSKLFVPGTRPDFFRKALAGEADALSLDLEDSVSPERKAEARDAVAALLRGLPSDGPADGSARKIMIVRVNGLDTPHFRDDVAAVVGPGLDAVNLPAAESADEVREAAEAVIRAARAAGLERPVGLLVNIETPRGLRCAAAIAAAHPAVRGLQIGYGDLFEPHGIRRDEEAALGHVRLAVRLAAAEAGVPAFDGSLAAVASPERCRAEAEAARRLGFSGKSCIHPSQVAPVNAAFLPGEAELLRARRVAEAADAAERDGLGAFLVDGQMVDAPFAASARALLALARRLGLEPPGDD